MSDDRHICGVCFRLSSKHPEQCPSPDHDSEFFWPPLTMKPAYREGALWAARFAQRLAARSVSETQG